MVENGKARRRVVTVALGVGVAFGVGVGATALAAAATSPATTPANSSTSTTVPAKPVGPAGGAFKGRLGFGGRFGGPAAFAGGFGAMGGAVVHGEYTVKGPNGYETIDVRSGTVSSVTDTSGSTWTLVVKSADGTSATFTVNSSTSVNGGESGIASVKTGDTVTVTATKSGSAVTATTVMDQTTLQANGKSWWPAGGKAPTGGETPLTPPGPPNSTPSSSAA